MVRARMAARGLPFLIAALAAACDEDEPRVASIPDAGMDATVTPPGADGGPLEEVDCRVPSLVDRDRDGYPGMPNASGIRDCDDCNQAIGPASIDLMDGVDDDCNGLVDDPVRICDLGTDIDDDSTDIEDVMRVLGICQPLTDTNSPYRWGAVRKQTRWRRIDPPDGGAPRTELEDPRQVWLTKSFGGFLPREGGRMLVLSTGVARDRSSDGIKAGYTEGCDAFESKLSGDDWSGGITPPEGFPYDSKRCINQHVSADTPAYNDVGFELTVRTPMNARALAFDSMFLTYEYPDWVCTRYNDFFVVLMDDAPRMYEHDNVLVDSVNEKNPIGVNSGLLSICQSTDRAARDDIMCTQDAARLKLLEKSGYAAGESTCAASMSGGKKDLGGASTDWLHTEVGVAGGKTVRLRFLLWDSGDPLLDSTVLLDNFRFLTTEPTTIATTPVTH